MTYTLCNITGINNLFSNKLINTSIFNMGSITQDTSPLWTPNPEKLSSRRLEVLRKKVNEKFGTKLGNYTYIHTVTNNCMTFTFP